MHRYISPSLVAGFKFLLLFRFSFAQYVLLCMRHLWFFTSIPFNATFILVIVNPLPPGLHKKVIHT